MSCPDAHPMIDRHPVQPSDSEQYSREAYARRAAPRARADQAGRPIAPQYTLVVPKSDARLGPLAHSALPPPSRRAGSSTSAATSAASPPAGSSSRPSDEVASARTPARRRPRPLSFAPPGARGGPTCSPSPSRCPKLSSSRRTLVAAEARTRGERLRRSLPEGSSPF